MADDIQINVGDLMSAFARETADAIKRAVIAETKATSMEAYIKSLRDEIVRLNARPPAQTTEVVPDPDAYRRGLEDGWNGHENGLSYEEAVGDVVRGVEDAPTAAVRKAPAKKAAPRRGKTTP